MSPPPCHSHSEGFDDKINQLLSSCSIPKLAGSARTNILCCCGLQHCDCSLQNNAALEDLESSLSIAAQLGQALLARHETHTAESEKTRETMSIRIQELEKEKLVLEAENSKTVEENRGLLDQLEDLNETIARSESNIKSLEATLQSAQLELRRLDGLAERTEDLEAQIAMLEEEQLALLHTVTVTEADGRLSVQRWKKAERHLNDVHDQLERIDNEAREERERHAEVVERLHRQQEVERELRGPAGGRPGNGAVSIEAKRNNNVVSHFVKDILQDNANLQLGLTELREMLMNSNDEVQALREQLMLQSPGTTRGNDDGPPTLRAELAPKEAPIVSQELHIHHHYHAPVAKEQPRLKKKRRPITQTLFAPPGQNAGGRLRPAPSGTTTSIMSQTCTSVPSPTTPNHRWSMQSETTVSDFAPSSAPTSPRSNYRTSSIFDRGFPDHHFDSSRPTSPSSSLDPGSPVLATYNRKRDSARSFAPSITFNLSNTIHEERGEDSDVEDLSVLDPSDAQKSEQGLRQDYAAHIQTPGFVEERQASRDYFNPMAYPSLRRVASHESILSISGIDIHTVNAHQAERFTVTGSNRLMNSRMRPAVGSLATSYVSAQPVTTTAMVTARPVLSGRGQDSSSYLRSSMGLTERPTSTRSNSSDRTVNANSGGSSKVGGWFGSRWGAAHPAPVTRSSASNLRAVAVQSPPPIQRAISTGAVDLQPEMDPLRAFMGGRPPGINQKGFVPGVWVGGKTPSKIVPDRIDVAALEAGLAELSD